MMLSLFQKLLRGITPVIKSSRAKKAAMKGPGDIVLSESSAKLLKNASFMTNNTESFNIANP